jgi:mono/diheme cytochrome c family protein
VTRRLVVALLLASCLAVSVSACGGSGQGRAPSSSQALFEGACGACHTLTGHNDPRHQGGDLLGFHATRPQMLQLASEMPVRRPLSQNQLNAVVRFVMALEAGRA